MTEENKTFELEESVPAGENPPEASGSSLPSGVTPLIPGTEIIGRRARRAALLAEASDLSERASDLTERASDLSEKAADLFERASDLSGGAGTTASVEAAAPAADLPAFTAPEAESGAEPEVAGDQIPLWDNALLESESDDDSDQIPLWDDAAIDEILARAQSWVSGEDEAAAEAGAVAESVEDAVISEDPETAENSEDTEAFEVSGEAEAAGEATDSSDLPGTDSEEFWNQLLSEDYYTPIEQIPRRRRPGEGSGGRRGKRPAGEIDDRLKRAPNKPKACAVSPFVEFVEVVVGALVAAILVLTLICRTGVVDGSSMVPTMYHGDRYIISDLFYVPERGDIVVFRPEIDGEDELWIKRVIATEGQTVYIDPESYQVYVDGRLMSEPYLGGAGTIPHSTENPITVPEGCVYVLGDNRAISHDSRYSDLGCVEIGQLAGRVILRFWPLESFGFCE